MKQKKPIRLSQQYETALEKLLKQGPGGSLQPALKLGHAAVALGLDTLELARMHDQAMVALGLSDTKNGFTKLAWLFFTEANAPIEATHRAAQQGQASLSRSQATLGQRTEELAASNRKLQRGIIQRKAMADAATKNGHDHQKSLQESLQLQKRLRQLTHRVMLSQEDERQHISHELQDEIAQTLLGINVRLLSLKQHARRNTKGFKEEIASTQRLVLKSAQSVRRVAREIGYQPEPSADVSASL
ncbi:MAG: histidine kinase [Verrucomicrobiae bacterium]|nr:histidine kinase [Verrucomicrobiae bacterium]